MSGADALGRDPLGLFNLTVSGYEKCTKILLDLVNSQNVKLLVVGGGGYNIANCARVFASCTAVLLGTQLSNDIPEHSCYEFYAPDFERHVEKKDVENENSKEYLEKVCKTVQGYIDQINS